MLNKLMGQLSHLITHDKRYKSRIRHDVMFGSNVGMSLSKRLTFSANVSICTC